MVPETLTAIAPTTQSGLVGVEPIEQIVMMENHDDAYYAWQKAGLRDRIVVHVDAHIDFGWMPERDLAELLQVRSLRELEEQSAKPSLWNFSGVTIGNLINVGNYLNPALREGIVRSMYWVAPDGFFRTPQQRKRLEKMLDTLGKTHPQAYEKIARAGQALRAKIYGKPLTVCPLSDLPEFEETVLLDIDTDFLVIDSMSASYPYAEPLEASPWIWPDKLVAKLHERRLRTDFVTIAYSVEGGYTPLGCKYLGDDLARLLRDPSSSISDRRIMSLKRESALQTQEKKLSEARHALMHGLARDSQDASIHYQLAQLFYKDQRLDDARAHYKQAAALDPSYRNAYNNFGPVYFKLGRLADSEGEYRKALTLDPDDADASYGLADLCAAQRRWHEAIHHYRRARELRSDDGRAHLGLGYVYAKIRDWVSAEDELRRILTSERYGARAQYWLGYVCSKRRHWDDALAAYRAARRLGHRSIWVHLGLGRLYLRKRNFYAAGRHYGKVARRLPAISLVAIRRLLKRTGRMLSRWAYDAESR